MTHKLKSKEAKRINKMVEILLSGNTNRDEKISREEAAEAVAAAYHKKDAKLAKYLCEQDQTGEDFRLAFEPVWEQAANIILDHHHIEGKRYESVGLPDKDQVCVAVWNLVQRPVAAIGR